MLSLESVKPSLKILFTFSISLLFVLGVSAAEQSLPRGANISAIAGQCSVGPFGQIEDAGDYQAICRDLTAAEICLAYIKGHGEPGGEAQSTYDPAKFTFCAQVLLNGRVSGSR